MSKLLVINAHADFDSKISTSLEIMNKFIEEYKVNSPSTEIEILNLYNEDIPRIDKEFLERLNAHASGNEIKESHKASEQRQMQILKQFKEAKQYVIVFPLYNLNIPSVLKDYIDNITVPRETFNYTEGGPIGLLNDGRSITLIESSGGVYTQGEPYASLDFAAQYTKAFFNFVGVSDFHAIRIEGTAYMERKDVIAKAEKETCDLVKMLSSKIK